MSGNPLQSMIHGADERRSQGPLPHPRHSSVEDGSDPIGDSGRGNSDDVPGVSLPMGAHGAVLLLVTFVNGVVGLTAGVKKADLQQLGRAEDHALRRVGRDGL